MYHRLTSVDPEITALLERERVRQNATLQLIPSHTLVETQGSILTNLTVEGYPGRRFSLYDAPPAV